ncbi:MAG: hypothetical protein BGO01_05905 [Armatimonadetes bacterium 55-13]|nr:MAG: hypothetical protein BGO01_05905 [Armatimonadetes bacterium 55-13]
MAGTTQRYYRENGLGSNVTTMTSSGSVDSRTEYDAYGVEYNVSSGTKSEFRFAGKHGYYTDDRSGLQLLGARYYMPALGRFLTQDPIGHEAGSNLYQYYANNPLVKTDATGLDWILYRGQSLTYYRGKYGGAQRPIFTIAATSGLSGDQETRYSNINAENAGIDNSGGPIPAGRYRIDLGKKPRTADQVQIDGDYYLAASNGISYMPKDSDSNSEYPNWGTWRARLERVRGKIFGRGNFYLHDSGKGYSHVSIESSRSGGDMLLKRLLYARRSGIKSIDVRVEYEGTSTRGNTTGN